MKAVGSLCVAACLLGMVSGPGWALGQEITQTTQAVNLPGNAVPARLIKMVQPRYPGVASANLVDGDVVMSATVAADGTVQNIKVMHGLPQLIESAVHAVSQWQYEPARVDGVAVALKTTITVHYKFSKETLQPGGSPQGEGMGAAAVPAPARPSLPPPPAGVVRISGRVMSTMVDKKVDPVYPPDSVAVDARGTVVLLATIKKTGEVSELQVVSGPQRFRDAATDAVKQWHYKPYLIDDQAVDVQTTIMLDFAPPAR